MPAELNLLAVLTQFAIILAIGMIAKLLSNKSRIPFVVLLIVAGTAFASLGLLDIEIWGNLPELIRTLALIIVVFSAGFHLQFGQISKHGSIILSLATFATLITVAIITGITFWLLSLSFIAAAFLGTLLGGSDAASLAEATKKEGRVETILLGESIFNNPLTVILPLIVLDYVVKPEIALLNIPKFFALIAIGAFIGFMGAFFGQSLLRYGKGKREQIVGLLIAIAVYVIAENLYGSGILAVAITSLLLSSKRIPEKQILGEFSDQLAFLFTVFVFVLLGMQFTVGHLAELSITRYEIVVILVALLIARLVSSQIVLFRSGLLFVERLKIALISPKGIAPAALAPLLLLYNIPGADTILKIVYIAIILSSFISLLVLRLAGEEPSIREQAAQKREEKEKPKASSEE